MKAKVYAIIVFVAAIVVGLAVSNQRHSPNEELLHMREKLSQLRYLNSVIVQEIFALHLGINQHYHRITKTLHKIDLLIRDIEQSRIHAKDDVFFAKFAAYANSLQYQRKLVEKFKTQNALYRNAQNQLLAIKTYINENREALGFSDEIKNGWNAFKHRVFSRHRSYLLPVAHDVEPRHDHSWPIAIDPLERTPLIRRAVRIGGLFLASDRQTGHLIRKINAEYAAPYWRDIVAFTEGKLNTQEVALVSRNTRLLYLTVVLSVVVILALAWLAASLLKLSQGKAELETAVSNRTAELEESKRALEHHRDTLEQTVQERTMDLNQKAQEYLSALVKESRVNKLQRDFVSMVSHEFRTPLSIIDMTAQRVARKNAKAGLPPDAIADFIQILRGNVRRLTNMVDRSLNISKLDADAMEFRLERFDVRALLMEICNHHESVAKNVRIYSRLDSLPNELEADYDMIYHIFSNLIGNAIKYSPDGGAVVIRSTVVGEVVRIEIIDQGIGIPENDIPKLFQRYFRASNAVQISGTGIGLVIVKEMIERHRGALKVVSAEGKGSAFIVTIPILATDDATAKDDGTIRQDLVPTLLHAASG